MGQTIAGLALNDPERFTLRGGYDRTAGDFSNLSEAGAQVAISTELAKDSGAAVIDFTHATVNPNHHSTLPRQWHAIGHRYHRHRTPRT